MKQSGESLYFLASERSAWGDIIKKIVSLKVYVDSSLHEHVYCFDKILSSLLRLICYTKIDSALVIHPLHAKQSFKETVAFS